MMFGDVLHRAKSEGHLLLVERRDGVDDLFVFETRVSWDCAKSTLTWKEGWQLSERMEQRERIPRPSDEPPTRKAVGDAETNLLAIACSDGDPPASARVLRTRVNPPEMTRSAFRLVAEGKRPFDALMQAGGITGTPAQH